MSEIKWGQVIITAIIVAIVVGLLVGLVFKGESAPIDGTNQTDCPTGNQTDCPTGNQTGTDCQTCQTCEEIEEAAKITGGYLIDDLFLEIAFNETLSDREIYLFDGEIEFDGDDYNADEFFTLTNLKLEANEGDFEGDVYLTIPTEGISYILRLEAVLNTSNIDEDETLELTFLGEEITISEWDSNRVTLPKEKNTVLLKKNQ